LFATLQFDRPGFELQIPLTRQERSSAHAFL